MRYLGNKEKLLASIEFVLKKYNITGETFADLFAGSGSVGDYFKKDFKILSNDFLYFSYVLNKAKILNKSIPDFNNFKKVYQIDVFTWLNNLPLISNDGGFIYKNYTPFGKRMFFTEENGLKIDTIRLNIEELFRNLIIDENEYFFLLASLIDSVTRFSNTSGTYEAFFKFWESRASKPFEIIPLSINLTSKLSSKNFVFNKDTNILIKEISGEIAYIDPPYTVTQYISAYHLLETVAKYDFPDIKGIGGKRDRGKKNSKYAQKREVKKQFEDLFRQINFKHILISYSNQGLIPINELAEIAKPFAKNKKVFIEKFDHRQYKNSREVTNKIDSLKECIIYFEKNLEILKSPLNYSGSKDTLISSIQKELPQSISTFVDVMGGAFNVGANIIVTNKVIYNEINSHIYHIIKWLLTTPNKECIVNVLEEKINLFKLEKGNKEAYYLLRNEYNKTKSIELLFLLHMYSFQNMIRFNNNNNFNTPCGVAGYSQDMKSRILNFVPKSSNIEFYNLNYKEFNWTSFDSDTLFYFDPPYFISTASYNDGKRGFNGWNATEEAELLETLTYLDSLGYKFLLSNVIYHKNKVNHLLLEWIEEHNYTIIEIGNSGARYSKKEVLIKNY